MKLKVTVESLLRKEEVLCDQVKVDSSGVIALQNEKGAVMFSPQGWMKATVVEVETEEDETNA